MRPLIALLFAFAPAAALAQSVTLQPAQPPAYQSAPWWMREPIIASLGEVRAEVPANRARLSVSFESIAATAPEATRAAADKARGINLALAAYGATRVRVETSFGTRPLYAQYKDKTGTIQDNQREDKVDRYAVTATLNVEVRDLAVVEKVYAALIAAKPTRASPAYFSLTPDNALNAALAKAAIADAAARARAAAADAGTRLGPIKLIDPTARACSTDVLIAGAPRSYGQGYANDFTDVVVTAERRQPSPLPPVPAPVMQTQAPPPPPPPPPGSAAAIEMDAASLQINLQPPLQTLTKQACVIYALGG